MLATPTELSKASNITWSLVESPTTTQRVISESSFLNNAALAAQAPAKAST